MVADESHRISPPPRVARPETAQILAITVLFGAFPLLPSTGVVAVAVATAAITATAWLRRERFAASAGLFCTLCFAGMFSGMGLSQLWLAAALALQAVVISRVPWLRGTDGWARRGSVGREAMLLSLAAAAVASVALLVWFVVLRPNVDDILRTFLPKVAPWLLIIGGVGFSVVNAVLEESAYRGVLLHALEAGFGRGATAIALQAVAFGAMHINGFPRGWLGVGLASIYGLMMGGIRVRAGGMFAPWIAHVLTDVAIVGILVALARVG